MAKLKWFGGKDNVDSLVARGKLDRAIQMLEAQLKEDPKSVTCRQQLGLMFLVSIFLSCFSINKLQCVCICFIVYVFLVIAFTSFAPRGFKLFPNTIGLDVH